MSIDKFNQTIFSQFIDYNSYDVQRLADNLFEKIRQTGILPTYVERSTEGRVKTNTEYSGISFSDNTNFSFGVSTNNEIFLSSFITIPKVFKVEFEVEVLSGFEFIIFDKIHILSGKIVIGSDLFFFEQNIQVGFNKIRLDISNNDYRVYCNSVLLKSFRTTAVNDYTFNNLFSVPVGVHTYIGNILIRDNQNRIVNYWKCNYEHPTLGMLDSGDGDYAFYSFWYPTCYLISLINKYREKLSDIYNDEFMLKKFLIDEKGLAIRN